MIFLGYATAAFQKDLLPLNQSQLLSRARLVVMHIKVTLELIAPYFSEVV